jgi:hypothetical protein
MREMSDPQSISWRPAVYTEADRALDQCREWLAEISIEGHLLHVLAFRLEPDDNCLFLQVTFAANDIDTGRFKVQQGRKWRVSYYCCKSEFVRTAYKAFEAAVLHEMQENFKYRGRSIYGPHIDPDALWEASAILDSRA